jgi:hypothetical protein
MKPVLDREPVAARKKCLLIVGIDAGVNRASTGATFMIS